jgi:hypothetical protein
VRGVWGAKEWGGTQEMGGEENVSGERSSVGPGFSSSDSVPLSADGVSDMMECSLPGLLVYVNGIHDGEMAYSISDVDDGDASDSRGVVGETEENTESRDVGASDRKLHSMSFLSQFAHDGCLTSHCFHDQSVYIDMRLRLETGAGVVWYRNSPSTRKTRGSFSS